MSYYRFEDLCTAAATTRQKDIIGESNHAKHQKKYGKDVIGNTRRGNDEAYNGMLIKPPYVTQKQQIKGLYRSSLNIYPEMITADWLYKSTIEDEYLYYVTQDIRPLQIPIYLSPNTIYHVSFELKNDYKNWYRNDPDEEYEHNIHSPEIYSGPSDFAWTKGNGTPNYYMLCGGEILWNYFCTHGILINTYEEYQSYFLSGDTSIILTQTDFLINNDYSWKTPYQGNFFLIMNTEKTFKIWDCFSERVSFSWRQGVSVSTIISSLYDNFTGKNPNILFTLLPWWYYYDFQILSYQARTNSFLLNMNTRASIYNPTHPNYTVNFKLEITRI